MGCPPSAPDFWGEDLHDFFHCHPGETRNSSNINTHSFHLHSYLPCKPIYDCTRQTSQGSPPNVQVGQISLSIQSSQLIHCLFLNWVSHHAPIHAMAIIWSGALLPLATELAQWCGHWNHRLMWPRISCYLWVDQLVCDAWDKTVLPSVFCEQHDSTYCTTGVCSTLLAPMSNLSWTMFCVMCLVRTWLGQIPSIGRIMFLH